MKGLSDLFLEHQLLVNEVRLRFQTDGSLERWLNELELRELRLGVIADGFATYLAQRKRFGVFLELDRGTESLNRWKGKVRSYLQLAASGRHTALDHKYFPQSKA